MTGWRGLALVAGMLLVAVATWTLSRAAYRSNRAVLTTAVIAWAGGIYAALNSLT